MERRTSRQGVRARFEMIPRACAGPGQEVGELEMFMHPLQECNSLLAAKAGVWAHGGDCVGKPAKRLKVPVVTLQPLLRQALAVLPRVQLLKLDVQGVEWPCLAMD